MKEVQYKWVQGGGVPGGHYCIYEEGKRCFICPTKEMRSIPLDYRDIVVDLGLYTGTYSIMCARHPVKEVRGFEPTKRSFDVANLIKLRNMKLYNKAVVNDDRKTETFYYSKGIGVTNSLVPSKAKVPHIVECANYNEIIKDATVVKCDIEGGEYDLDLIQPHIRAYIIDFHKVGKDWIEKAEAIIKKLDDYGYRCVIKPKWTCGWTQAGSWIKDDFDWGQREPNNDLIFGKYCLGCGSTIDNPKKRKAICNVCEPLWLTKHKIGMDVVNTEDWIKV